MNEKWTELSPLEKGTSLYDSQRVHVLHENRMNSRCGIDANEM